MKIRLIKTSAALLVAAALLAGCGGFSMSSLVPFSSDGPKARSTAPANATEYQCNGGKRFYLRNIDNDTAVWLIYPDREARLDKVTGEGGNRYSNGPATLDLTGGEAKLTDGTASYTACKAVAKP